MMEMVGIIPVRRGGVRGFEGAGCPLRGAGGTPCAKRDLEKLMCHSTVVLYFFTLLKRHTQQQGIITEYIWVVSTKLK